MAGGRPKKSLDPFVSALKEVLEDKYAVMAFTYEELIDEAIDRLEDDEKVSKSTIRNEKRKQIQEGNDSEFLTHIKRAERKVKKDLMKEHQEGKGQWQRFAWVLERKYGLVESKKVEHNGQAFSITIGD